MSEKSKKAPDKPDTSKRSDFFKYPSVTFGFGNLLQGLGYMAWTAVKICIALPAVFMLSILQLLVKDKETKPESSTINNLMRWATSDVKKGYYLMVSGVGEIVSGIGTGIKNIGKAIASPFTSKKKAEVAAGGAALGAGAAVAVNQSQNKSPASNEKSNQNTKPSTAPSVNPNKGLTQVAGKGKAI